MRCSCALAKGQAQLSAETREVRTACVLNSSDSMYFSFRFLAAPSSVTSSDTGYRCPHLRMAMSISCRRPFSHADTEKHFVSSTRALSLLESGSAAVQLLIEL